MLYWVIVPYLAFLQRDRLQPYDQQVSQHFFNVSIVYPPQKKLLNTTTIKPIRRLQYKHWWQNSVSKGLLEYWDHIKLTESNVSSGRLSRWRLMTAFPSRCISFKFTNPRISRPPSVSFLSRSFSGTSLNNHNSEPWANNASRTWKLTQVLRQISFSRVELNNTVKPRVSKLMNHSWNICVLKEIIL